MTTESLTLDIGNHDLQYSPASYPERHLKKIALNTKSLYMIKVDNIHVKEGFNVRLPTEQYEQHIERLKESIIEDGFHDHEPIGVFVDEQEPGEHKVFVHSGHSRLEAVKRAIRQGVEINSIPCIMMPKGTNRQDITLSLITSNEGKPLEPLERAAVLKMLVKYGMKINEIARRTSLSERTVRYALTMMESPQELLDLIVQEKVSYSKASELISQYGHDKALKKIKANLDQSSKEKYQPVKDNRKKATRIIAESAPTLYETISVIHTDPGFEALSAEVRNKINELITCLSEKISSAVKSVPSQQSTPSNQLAA